MAGPPARVTKQLIIMVEPHVFARVRAMATENDVSMAQVGRDLIDASLVEVERRYARRRAEADKRWARPTPGVAATKEVSR